LVVSPWRKHSIFQRLRDPIDMVHIESSCLAFFQYLGISNSLTTRSDSGMDHANVLVTSLLDRYSAYFDLEQLLTIP
jgi:hypothetical protein